MVATNPWFWIAFVAFVLGMLALDLGVFHRKAHEIRAREAAIWTGVWVALALAFAAGLHFFYGSRVSLPFLTGYLIEEALSVDNIFVIVLIFEYFRVPKIAQHRVLFYGILGALAMRGVFIGVGTLLIARFHWVIYIFGAFLIFTGVRMALGEEEEFDGERNIVARLARKAIPLSPHYDGPRFFILEHGRRLATPLWLVLVLVEFTDLVFAADSIPAIFGVTRDPFIVFTSNIFAVLGLRSLFFLLASVVDRFYLLKYGLAIILTFIGVKMIGERWIHVDILPSLGIVVAVLGASIAASLLWPRKNDTPASDAGDRGAKGG